MSPLIDLALPLARLLDPETAHRLALAALKTLPTPAAGSDDPRLAVEAFGRRFSNPIGLAAGFDKDAEVAGAALGLGFGFVEVGTLTPKAQGGNPRPRLFRLAEDQAVINRLGFNNGGFAPALRRLAGRRMAGPVGVNIGANRESPDWAADFSTGVETFAPVADYLTVNISSPNTPGLRELQSGPALDELLARLIARREHVARGGRRTPLLIKIAPDLSPRELDDIVAVARRRAIDGIVVGNTTVSRPRSLRAAARAESGGLSGAPLFPLSTRVLAEVALRADGKLALIGVGGVDSGAAALTKIRAGATLVQLYTSLIFHGFSVVAEIKRGLVDEMEKHRRNLAGLIGVDAATICREPWPD